jgi:hypothetical protein
MPFRALLAMRPGAGSKLTKPAEMGVKDSIRKYIRKRHARG